MCTCSWKNILQILYMLCMFFPTKGKLGFSLAQGEILCYGEATFESYLPLNWDTSPLSIRTGCEPPETANAIVYGFCSYCLGWTNLFKKVSNTTKSSCTQDISVIHDFSDHELCTDSFYFEFCIFSLFESLDTTCNHFNCSYSNATVQYHWKAWRKKENER